MNDDQRECRRINFGLLKTASSLVSIVLDLPEDAQAGPEQDGQHCQCLDVMQP